MKALGAVCGVPWAITEPWLEALCAIAAREDPDIIAGLEALQGRAGERLNWRGVSTKREGGVRIIEIAGPIFRRADFFTSISGATDTGTLAKEFGAAVEDEGVHSILLEVDSPGGEAAAIGEFAGMIRAATEKKPVVAYVSDLGCSGAYWLASAADRVVAAPTATLGSIGVVMVHTDTREAERRRGITRQQFVSSRAPNKRPDLDTDAGRAQVQKVVDDIEAVFVSDVARFRGVSEETVTSDFGAGGVLVGEHAVAAGMADELGTLEGLVSQLAQPERHIAGGSSWRLGAPGTVAARAAGRDTPRSAARENTMPENEGRTEAGEAGFWKGLVHRLVAERPAAEPVLLTAGAVDPAPQVQAATKERDAEKARADKAEGDLAKCCQHFADAAKKSAVRAGTPLSEREERVITAAVAQRDWEFLVAEAGDMERKAAASLPTGTAADVAAATKAPEGEDEARRARLAAKAKAGAAKTLAAQGNGRAQ